MPKVRSAAQRHWFYLVLPLLLAAALGFRTSHPWGEQPQLGELITLFDWCLFVPALYAICYRGLPRRALAIRTLAIVCGGVWIAGKIVPDSAEIILAQWSWLRWVGITLLVLVEALAFVAVMRVVLGATPDPGALERQGIPPLVVKLMLAEARFWRWLWVGLRGR